MLDDLLKLVDEKELKAFTRQARIVKPANYEIAEKNSIITKEAASSLSKAVATIHTALNVVEATTKNKNNIEKARLERLDTSTKENYMEARRGRGDTVATTTETIEIAGVVKALAAFNNLLEDLDDAMQKLDLSCNICQSPCDEVNGPVGVGTRIRTPSRTRVRTPVSVPRTEPVAIPSRQRVSQTQQLGLPAPSVRTPAQAPSVRSPAQLPYEPLPNGDVFREQVKPREKVPVSNQRVESKPEFRGRTAAEQEIFKGTEGKTAAEIRAERRQARLVGNQPVSEPAPRAMQPTPAPQQGRPRWTADVPKEQYFDRIRANQAQEQTARRARATAAPAAPRAAAAPASKPGLFNRVMTGIAESKAVRVGGRILGVVGTGADVYSRRSSGQSWSQVGAGVGGGLVGAAAGGKAGAVAGGAIGAAFGGVGAVPGAFIGGLIGGGLGYFGGSKLGDMAYNKVTSEKKPPVTPRSNPGDKTASRNAIKSLTTATKKVTTGQKKVAVGMGVGAAGGVFASLADKLANFIQDTIQSVSSYVSNLPSMLSGAAGAVGSFFSGFNQGLINLPPAGSSENANRAVDFFMGRGWTREQAAGIVGNLQAESTKNLNPNAVGDNGNAWGIAQWNQHVSPDRVANFRRVMGVDLRGSTFEQQLAFVDWELNNTEIQAGRALRAATTPEQAAIAMAGYERYAGWLNPNSPSTRQRVANAIHLGGGVEALAQSLGYSIGAGVGGFVDTATGIFRNAQFVLPVGNARITSPFGTRTHPVYGGTRFHNGVDFGIPMGTPVRAAQSGIVTFAENRGGGGWSVGISHADGWSTGYAHLSRFLVAPRQRVEAGQVIALSGGAPGHPGSGASTGAHLHFTMQRNGSHVNPAQYLSGAGLSAVNPEQGNLATEPGVIRRTPGQQVVPPAPAKGGYLADIFSGNAARRRAAQRPRVSMIPLAPGVAPVPASAFFNSPRPPAGRTPSPANQYRDRIAGR